jgi:hypothetical protein
MTRVTPLKLARHRLDEAIAEIRASQALAWPSWVADLRRVQNEIDAELEASGADSDVEQRRACDDRGGER